MFLKELLMGLEEKTKKLDGLQFLIGMPAAFRNLKVCMCDVLKGRDFVCEDILYGFVQVIIRSCSINLSVC